MHRPDAEAGGPPPFLKKPCSHNNKDEQNAPNSFKVHVQQHVIRRGE